MSRPNQIVFPFFNYYPSLFMAHLSFHHRPEQLQTTTLQPRETSETPTLQTSSVVRKASQKVIQGPKKKIEKKTNKKKKEKQEDYSRKHQKKDRNLPSNVFKILSNYVYENSKLTDYLKALSPPSSQVDPQPILQKFRELVKPNQSYIRPSTIQSLYSGDVLSPEESKVFRVFVGKFLRQQFPVIITQQPKLRKGQKIAYFKLARTLQIQLSKSYFN